jgi:hypothetical protein
MKLVVLSAENFVATILNLTAIIVTIATLGWKVFVRIPDAHSVRNVPNIQNIKSKEPTMLTIQEINSTIMHGNFTNEELSSIANAIRFNRAQLVKQTKRELTIGANVKFTHPKTGRVHTGQVIKIKIKNVNVLENGISRWNVPANLLEVV